VDGGGRVGGEPITDTAAKSAAGPPTQRVGVNVGDGLVVGHDDMGEGQLAEVQDAAAGAGDAGRIPVGLAVGDRQPFDGRRGAGTDVEDPAGVIATDGYLVTAATILVVMVIMVVVGHSFYRQVVGDGQFLAAQIDLMAAV